MIQRLLIACGMLLVLCYEPPARLGVLALHLGVAGATLVGMVFIGKQLGSEP